MMRYHIDKKASSISNDVSIRITNRNFALKKSNRYFSKSYTSQVFYNLPLVNNHFMKVLDAIVIEKYLYLLKYLDYYWTQHNDDKF